MSQPHPLLAKLNPPQHKAVCTLNGPLLILSGAGSGKTRVLTYRFAHLVTEGLAAPHEILAVTFTNKAAKEMEHRILGLLNDMGVPVFERMWIGTFHSICVRILRQYIDLLEYNKYFSIYDSSDQLSMLKKVLSSLHIDEKMAPAKGFASRINSAKMQALDPAAAKNQGYFVDKQTYQVYARYEEEMKQANALDFNDLLFKTYELFRSYPDVVSRLQEQFRFIMVDEYQDTNHIQYLLVKMLSDKHRNLCVVGDEDQSIYSWRGADISNILDFEKDFPEAEIVKLEQNYRSSQTIVNAASDVIKNNSQRKVKTLFTDNGAGDKIEVREEQTEYDEARFVAKAIRSLMDESHLSYKDFAIFYRTNAQSRVIEDQCRTMGLPYRMVGGLRFYDRMEIKDILSYLKLILNPGDDVAFKRVINVPARGIGKTTIDKIEDIANQTRIRMVEAAMKAVQEKVVHSGAQKKISGFLNLLVDLRREASDLNIQELYKLALERTGYLDSLKHEDTPEAQARIENLEELDNAISQFLSERGEEATLQNFLEEMALLTDLDVSKDDENSITLMTLHVSKGLEFPVVFIVGMEEGLFPGHQAAESFDVADIEEERRLFYVGMTRAREKLHLLYARQRRIWGQTQFHSPSRFLGEIPKQYVQASTSVQRPSFVDRMRLSNQSGTEEANSFSSDSPKYRREIFPDYEGDSGAQAISSYRKGQKVRHPTYGAGSILSIEGSGDQTKVSVVFSDYTVKKFVAKYARLESL